MNQAKWVVFTCTPESFLQSGEQFILAKDRYVHEARQEHPDLAIFTPSEIDNMIKLGPATAAIAYRLKKEFAKSTVVRSEQNNPPI